MITIKEMKKIKEFILLNLILIIFVSCTPLKEGLTNQKKKSSDEFFVEKKLPLAMPPNYGELPSPNSEEISKDDENISKISRGSNIRPRPMSPQACSPEPGPHIPKLLFINLFRFS